MPLNRKNSAASWWRSLPPLVRNDHSRLSTYDTIVATMIAMIFAVTGFSSRTVSFSRYQMPLSMTNVVPPTMANFSSSRCLSSSFRKGSGTRESTVSTTVTPAVYGARRPDVALCGFVVLTQPDQTGAAPADPHHAGPRVRLREHPLPERPPAEDHRQQRAEDDAAREVRDLLRQQGDMRHLEHEHVA